MKSIATAIAVTLATLGVASPAGAKPNTLRSWCASHADQLPYAGLIRQHLPAVLVRVSCCESQGKPGAGRHHSSKGLLQVNWGANGAALRRAGIAHSASDLYVPSVNVRAAAFVLRTQGLQAWNPSRRCWG